MRPITDKVMGRLLASPMWGKCMRREALHDHECGGRITLEHAMIHAGRQVDEEWAIIFLCAYSHAVDQFQDGGILNKEINEWIALNRATREDFNKYERHQWGNRRDWLNKKYGKLLDSVKYA